MGTCGQEACLVGLVLTGGLNGTMTGAAGQTGCSKGEKQRQNVKDLSVCVASGWTGWSQPFMSGSLPPVQGSAQHAGEGAGFLSGCSRAVADEQRRSDARRTAGLQKKKRQVKPFVLHLSSVGSQLNEKACACSVL